MNASSGSKGVIEASTTDSEPAPIDESPYLAPDETCAELSVRIDSTPCYRPRSCRSCLKKIGCVVSEYGSCETAAEIGGSSDVSSDFRQAYDWNLVLPNATTNNASALDTPQRWRFPAMEAHYCSADDATCRSCIEARFWAPSMSPDSRFCAGAGGCICVAICEAVEPRKSEDCSSVPTPYASMGVYEHPVTSITIKIIGVVMGALLLLMAACLFRCLRRNYDERRRTDAVRTQRSLERDARRQRRRQRQQRAITNTHALSLSGWRNYRQSAIDKEKSRLGGEPPIPSSSAFDDHHAYRVPAASYAIVQDQV